MGRRWLTRKVNYILKSNLPISLQNINLKSINIQAVSGNVWVRDPQHKNIDGSASGDFCFKGEIWVEGGEVGNLIGGVTSQEAR